MMKLTQLLPIIIWIVYLIQCGGVAIVNDPDITLLPSLKLYVDPPSGHSSPAALGVFARASDPSALVYYTSWDTTKDAGVMYPPSLDSDDSNTVFISEETPYIQLDTPFRATRARTLILVAVVEDDGSLFRSEQLVYNYTIEGSARPYSYGFLVPGIESGGHFVRYGIEIAAKARAQVAGGQEFADFDTNLGIGTYDSQIKTLNLQDIDPELTGFEGGFPVNTSSGKHFGYLVPFHNGERFFGKVVRIDLRAMSDTVTTTNTTLVAGNATYITDTTTTLIGTSPTNVSIFTRSTVIVYDGTSVSTTVTYSNQTFLNQGAYKTPEGNTTYLCLQKYRIERLDAHGKLVVNTTVSDPDDACVFIIDLGSKHPRAVGFRRGFVGYPYGYLSAGHYSVVARLDLENFGLQSTRLIDLSQLDKTYGGYSGGFSDGTWACFNPFLTYSGPVGGIRSTLPVDGDHLRPYYYSVVLCMNSSAWTLNTSLSSDLAQLSDHVYTIDLSTIEDNLRGFSEAVRVGRYAYLAPLSNSESVYSSKLIRIDLGEVDIGTTLKTLESENTNVRTIIDILDLSKKSETMRGFSGLFSSGQNLFLVPFRNSYEPRNGQRGHGTLTRLNMNDFELSGVDSIDIPTTIRTQVPSFPDFKLRGFMGGFASGYYGMLVPFYNADFNGLIARFKTMDSTLDSNLQELNLMLDRDNPNLYKGYRGGFASLWQAVLE